VASRIEMGELISLRPRFLRSVHLERDFYAKDAANGYLITRGVRSALSLLGRGFSDPSYRAQCISGPYGSGKSALALFFAKLLDQMSDNGLRDKSRPLMDGLSEQFFPPSGQGFITILATGTRESISTSLMRGIERSLKKSGQKTLYTELVRKHKFIEKTNKADTRTIVDLFETLAKLAVEKEKALGTIVVVDELGKLLEHAALQPEDNDLQVLQEMAEVASRSDEYPMWFVGILHQQFTQYASRLGRRHQQEWARVQQRFFDVPCLLDDVDALQLAAAALDGSGNKRIRSNPYIKKAAKACAGLAPRGSEASFQELCVSSYPLHPTTLILLPALFRRFGQNERSLFSFLSANETFSLGYWIQNQDFTADTPPFLCLPHLYDYASHTLIGGSPTPQVARAWAEVEDAIMRLGDATVAEIDTLKTIGLIGLVGETSRIQASRQVLDLSLTSYHPSQTIDRAIQRLIEKRLIVFRRFRSAYRLWEGSDVDISQQLLAAYQTLPAQSVVLSVAKDLCPSPPSVARRHSFRTGMLRYFSILPCSKDDLLSLLEIETQCDGRIMQCLVDNDERRLLVENICKTIRDTSVIVLIGRENDELAEAARDVAALEWVRQNTPALAGDRVARQELSERRLEAEMAFRSEWQKIFGPGSRNVVCYLRGEKRCNLSARAFAALLSDSCDTTFQYAPILKNELINRRQLSSQSNAARRRLIEAMISLGDHKGLDFSGYPPARSIYESLLFESGIHTKDDNGQWGFDRPNDSDPGLQKSWDHITRAISSENLKPKSISELFKELSGPPYGLSSGFTSVLFCAWLIANSATIALYENNAFVPELSAAVMERMVSKPDNFSGVSFKLQGERALVVERFARGFKVSRGILPVVRSLYARMGSLPEYTKMTNNLPPNAIAVRETILRAKSPERLLFIDLPAALGCKQFQSLPEDPVNEENIETFFNEINKAFKALINCYPNLLDYVRKGLLDIFDVSEAESNWRNKVLKRANILNKMATDFGLRTILVRARDAQLGETEYLESLGAVIASQPPNKWSKANEENFARIVPQLASQVHALESAQVLDSALQDGEDGYLLSINSRNGQSIRRVVRFSDKDRAEIDGLVRTMIDQKSGFNDRRIILAAITKAALELIEPKAAEESEVIRGTEVND